MRRATYQASTGGVALGLLLAATLTAAAQTPPPPPAPAPAATAPAPAPVLQQEALDLLKKMSDTLAAAKSFSVDVRDLREVRTTPGQMMMLVSDAEITLQRPDRLRVEAKLGSVDTLMIYDGQKFQVLDKPKNLYVSVAAPKTLDETLDTVARKHGLQLGMSDLLVSNPYAVLGKGLTNAYVAGAVTLGDDATTQAVYAAPGIEFQLWIDTKTSLPKLMTETYLGGPRPVHVLIEFDDWDLDADIDAKDFAFVPPAGAKPIKFLVTRQ